MTTTHARNRSPLYGAPTLALAIFLTGALLALPAAAGDGAEGEDPHPQHHAAEGGMMGDAGSMSMDHCQAMKAHRQEMMEKRQAADAELDEMMEAVRSASGDAKLEAMEKLLGELVEQRSTMGGMMSGAPCPMMGSMMQHMSMMMGEMGEGAMEECPMMKKMMSQGDNPSESGGADHSAHHPGG